MSSGFSSDWHVVSIARSGVAAKVGTGWGSAPMTLGTSPCMAPMLQSTRLTAGSVPAAASTKNAAMEVRLAGWRKIVSRMIAEVGASLK